MLRPLLRLACVAILASLVVSFLFVVGLAQIARD